MPGSGCVIVQLLRTRDPVGLDSAPICSGVVWPTSSINVESGAAFLGENPVAYCTSGMTFGELNGRSWSNFCSVKIISAR